MAQENQKTIEDVHSTTSNLSGMKGFLESVVRKFRIFAFASMCLGIILIGIFCIGISLIPSIFFMKFVYQTTIDFNIFLHVFLLALSLAASYFIYGFTLIFVVPFINTVLGLRLKPFRCPLYSLKTMRWYLHNALTYIVRYTFLEFITPSPFNIMFYKGMGMKIGKNVAINTSNISDPSLITLEKNVLIGGSATIFAHYAMKGYLVVEPVIIGKNVDVGLKSTIMGNVKIEEGAKIRANSVVYPKSLVPKNESVEGYFRSS